MIRTAKYTFGVGSDSAFSAPLTLAVPSEVTIDTPPAAIPVTTATTLTGTVAPSGAAVAVVDGTTVLGAATVVGTTWTFSWTPGVAAIGAHPSVHATSGSANSAPVSTTVALAEDFAAIGGGPDQLHWARSGEEYETLSGSDVTLWQDLSGHGNHATDGTDRPVYVDVPGGDSYLEFTGVNNDHLLVPYAGLSAASHVSVFVSMRSAGAATYNVVYNVYNGLWLARYSNALFIGTATNYNGSISGIDGNVDHAVLVTLDGEITDPHARMRVWIDSEERQFDAAREWPAALPTLTGGCIGQMASEVWDFNGRLHALAVWYNTALAAQDVVKIFDAARVLLSYSSTWTDSGTALVEHINPELVVGDEIPLTETSLAVTPGTPIVVYDKGVAHAGFTSLEDRGAGVYRVYFRHGASHVEPTGKIVYSESSDYGATWGAPVDLIDTLSVDDRDPYVIDVDGVPVLFWVRWTDDYSCQLFSRPVAGGAIENVFGYPQIVGTQKVTSKATLVDDGAIIVSYGGPDGTAGWMCTRVDGTDVYWTPPAIFGASRLLLYEPSMIRLASGGLLCHLRTEYGTRPLLQLRSVNGDVWTDARTWPGTHDGEHLGVDAPCLFQLSTGTLVSVGRRRYATGVPLTLLYSVDDGVTWSAPVDMLDLVAVDGGYCGIIEVDPTHILISYYCQYAGYIQRVAVLPVTIEAA